MPRREERVIGPERATLQDIDGLNRLFSDAFTDRYHRDGLPGVRVPLLSHEVWRYAIEDAGEGALVWRDRAGHLAGFNMVHLSGTEGWMGPLAVRPTLQGLGVGQRIVQTGVDWLRQRGAGTIGLETMPRTVDNIGFYSQLGFRPGFLTITLMREGEAEGRSVGEVLSAAGPERAARVAECRELTQGLAPGVDYSRELLLTAEHRLGDTTLLRRAGALIGFALWHTIPMALGRMADEIRILKIVARDQEALLELLDAVGAGRGGSADLSRVALRCQSRYTAAYAALLARGYRVHWTDLRMTLEGYPEAEPAGILMSNWEI